MRVVYSFQGKYNCLNTSLPATLSQQKANLIPSQQKAHCTLFPPQPLDGPLNPVEATVRLDMAMLGVFNRVLNTFRELVKPFHPSIYINDSLAGDLKLNKDNLVYITVKDLP